MSSSENYVTEGMLLRTAYAMIAVTSAVFLLRAAARIWRPKRIGAEDYILLLAYLLFLTTAILYVVVTPAMYRVTNAITGKTPMYATILEDSMLLIKIFFANTMIFWFTLWAVKFSFLALYYRLMSGIKRYMQLWWAVLIFCILTLIGCVVSNMTSCSSMHAWFTPGECATPRDVRAQIASLYYAFAVDVITDLMIMFLPIGLIWNLQRPKLQKIGMGVLFGIGWICVAMATVRVVQIGSRAGNNSTPSSSWLALWAIIECAIAVIVGCGPGLYSTAKEVKSTRAQTYGSGRNGYAGRYTWQSEGYQRQKSASRKDVEMVGMSSTLSEEGYPKRDRKSIDALEYQGDPETSSREGLTVDAGTIQVKQTVDISEVDIKPGNKSGRGYDW